MSGSIGARDFESGRGDIGRMDFSLGQLLGKRETDAAGSGSHIGNSELWRGFSSKVRLCQSENCFDDVLRLGSWNQHRRRNDEVHAPEFLVSGNVLRGNPSGALGERRAVATMLIFSELAFGMCKQISTIATEHEPQQQLRIHLWGGNLFAAEVSYRRGQSLLELHTAISPQARQR